MQEGLKKQNIQFKTHVPLLSKYQVDLFIKPNLIVECDGDYWHNLLGAQEKDKKKDFRLKEAGYNVLRFWEHEILENKDTCLKLIKNELS